MEWILPLKYDAFKLDMIYFLCCNEELHHPPSKSICFNLDVEVENVKKDVSNVYPLGLRVSLL